MANSTNWPFEPANDTWDKVLAADVTGYAGNTYVNVLSTQKFDDPNFPPVQPSLIPGKVGSIWSNTVDNFMRASWPVIAGLIGAGYFKADGSLPMAGNIDMAGYEINRFINGTNSPNVGLRTYMGYAGNSGVIGDPTTLLVAGSPGNPGTYTVVGGTAVFRETDSYTANLVVKTWGTSADRTISQGTAYYVGLRLIAGVAVIVELSSNKWNFLNEIPLGIVSNTLAEGVKVTSTSVQLANLGSLASGRFLETQVFGRTAGLRLTAVGVGGLSLQRSSGRAWIHQRPVDYVLYSSDPTYITPSTFPHWYGDSVNGWTEVAAADTYDVNNYYGGSGSLATLTTAYYGVKWVYMNTTSGDLLVVYGTSNVAASQDATAEAVPTSLPPGYALTWVLLGRLIFQKGSAAVLVEDVWTTNFPGIASGGGEFNTGANVGSAGQGLYKGKSGATLQFKNIAPGSSKITVTPAVTDNIAVDVVPANVEAELGLEPRPPTAHTHPYLPLDGTDAMEGDLDLNAFDILNVTDINGRNYIEYVYTLDWGSSTGIIYGGSLSINGVDPTKFDISAALLVHTDSYTSANTVRTYQPYVGVTGATVTDLATQPITWVGIDSGLSVVQQTTPFSEAQKRDIVYIGKLYHVDNSIITAIGREQRSYVYPANEAAAFHDIFGSVNLSGNVFSAASTNLTVTKSAGTSWLPGANYQGSRKTASHTVDGFSSPVPFRYVYRDSPSGFVTGAAVTNAVPNFYDDGSGTLAAVPPGSWTVQHIFFEPSSGETRVHYGQAVHSSKASALASVDHEALEYDPLLNTYTLRASLVIAQGATNLSNTSQAEFIPAGKFALQRLSGLSTLGYSASATTFLSLTDTPSTFAGQSGKISAVNTGATALDFYGIPSAFVVNVPTAVYAAPVAAGQTITAAKWTPTTIRLRALTAPSVSTLTVTVKCNGTSIGTGTLTVGSTTSSTAFADLTTRVTGDIITVETSGSDTGWANLIVEANGTVLLA